MGRGVESLKALMAEEASFFSGRPSTGIFNEAIDLLQKPFWKCFVSNQQETRFPFS